MKNQQVKGVFSFPSSSRGQYGSWGLSAGNLLPARKKPTHQLGYSSGLNASEVKPFIPELGHVMGNGADCLYQGEKLPVPPILYLKTVSAGPPPFLPVSSKRSLLMHPNGVSVVFPVVPSIRRGHKVTHNFAPLLQLEGRGQTLFDS